MNCFQTPEQFFQAVVPNTNIIDSLRHAFRTQKTYFCGKEFELFGTHFAGLSASKGGTESLEGQLKERNIFEQGAGAAVITSDRREI